MQAIILAAGMGRRLGHYTDGNTKCMVKVGGKTLIQRMLDCLTRHPISLIVLVVGYKGDNLRTHVGEKWNGVDVVYVCNEIYDETNNIYSLYLAKDYLLGEETILLESDLIFSDAVLDSIIEDPRESLVMVSRFRTWMDGTVVRISKNQKIREFIPGKKFDYAETDRYFKTVNIYKFSPEFSKKRYLPFLEAYIQSVGHNEYYEQVLNVINFLEGSELRACVLNDRDLWYEIDDKQDLDNAEILFAEKDERLARLQGRYGGYWRYPDLTDFCYLVNPYFPPKRLLQEMGNSLSTLVSEYPSGENVQNLLASRMFDIHRENIMTGNGAAELINVMMDQKDRVTGIVLPTFNEYLHRVDPEYVRCFRPENSDFRYGVEELKAFSEGLDRLVLINPDNPSGNFIPKSDVLELARYLNEKGVRLILDESFVDFSQESEANSLIDDGILESLPNLVVVKSISKSYGVPGLRLGILACADRDFLAEIRRGLSIWNINSFAEFFLQIIGKYKSKYARACGKIAKERARFRSELNKIPGIRPLESQANYITCELDEGMKATELTGNLLDSDNLFIKDLTGKKGIPEDREYVRLAVRNRKDNDRLVNALTKMFGCPQSSR